MLPPNRIWMNAYLSGYPFTPPFHLFDSFAEAEHRAGCHNPTVRCVEYVRVDDDFNEVHRFPDRIYVNTHHMRVSTLAKATAVYVVANMIAHPLYWIVRGPGPVYLQQPELPVPGPGKHLALRFITKAAARAAAKNRDMKVVAVTSKIQPSPWTSVMHQLDRNADVILECMQS